LHDQERKLLKNAKGESIAKDTTKEEKARDQRKGHIKTAHLNGDYMHLSEKGKKRIQEVITK
jgi:hypothetical protein